MRNNRQEATAIPNLLVAPRDPADINDQDHYEDDDVDYAGYYEDGAYYASDHDHTAANANIKTAIQVTVRHGLYP